MSGASRIAASSNLPPGQHLAPRFVRYGTHLFRPIPDLSVVTSIRVTRGPDTVCDISHGGLGALSRSDMTADFHCVAGWSAQGLRWSGVSLRTLYAAAVSEHA